MNINTTYITLITLLVFFSCNTVNTWETFHKPKFYGHQVPNKLISPDVKKVQRRIVILHDHFRSKVIPPASNMLVMKWHRGAARSAQLWAQQCEFLIHDSPKSRFISNFGTCGQNIFVSSHKVPWRFALKTWFMERQNFTYGSNSNYLKEIGHYTQMVWAATHKVGCGLAKCSRGPDGKPFYNYVCNYCPSGNFYDKVGFPYKTGKPCESCVKSCLSKEKRLCTNTCNAVDIWANCAYLYQNWGGWLCNDASPKGIERRYNCRATCSCHEKIHD